MSRSTVAMSTIAMMLKQIDEMLHDMPTRIVASVLSPSATSASDILGIHAGTIARSRRAASSSTSPPTSSRRER